MCIYVNMNVNVCVCTFHLGAKPLCFCVVRKTPGQNEKSLVGRNS